MKYWHNMLFSGATIFILFAIVSCDDVSSPPKEEVYQDHVKAPTSKTITDGNISITTSTDIDKLGELLELRDYPPTSVKFQHTIIENYGYESEHNTAVKPDYEIEAVMNFDSTTFKLFMYSYSKADWVSPKYDKKEFEFSWLDEKTKQEIQASDSNYHGHPDFFWTYPNDPNCHLWILNRKVLLHRVSQ